MFASNELAKEGCGVKAVLHGTFPAWPLSVFLLGCGPLPQSAVEFRAAVKDGAFMTTETSFEVERPWQEVGQTFQEQAEKCLKVNVATASMTNQSYQHIVSRYHPTVVIGSSRAELHIQRKHTSGAIGVRKEPADGHYLVVADASPLDKGRTRIDIFGPAMGSNSLVDAIKSWTAGENLDCPMLE
ncbi:MAG: hypothetical protein R3B13_26755 [Polyangiaceae bacterium]